MSAIKKIGEFQSSASAGTVDLVLTSEQSIEPLAPSIQKAQVIEIQLPKFTDGRVYSLASLLRREYQYQGRLRVTGDVLLDQLVALRRVGFDQIELRADQSLSDAQRVCKAFSEFYQDRLKVSVETETTAFQLWVAP